MKIKTVQKSKDKITLLIQEAQIPLVNALRRSCIANVPTMAIEDVGIMKNSSPLYDEIIAHRLGLIPLTTDHSYSNRESCKCKGEGCSRCQVTLSLIKEGPGNVYSKDFTTSDPKVKPAHPDMLIVYLDEGQELNVEAKAQLGTGRQHAKWSSGLAYYRFYPVIKVNTKNVGRGSKKVVDACPKHVLNWKAGKIVVNKKNLENCDLCSACIKISENNELSVEPDQSKIFFTFESWGQLPAKTVFDKALNVVKTQLKELSK